jgi:hypothetical protein
MTTHQFVIDHPVPSATVAGNISRGLPCLVDSQEVDKDAGVGFIREGRP